MSKALSRPLAAIAGRALGRKTPRANPARHQETPSNGERSPAPEVYRPRLQLVFRLLQAALVAVYLAHFPSPPLLVAPELGHALIAGYALLHLALAGYGRRRGPTPALIRLGYCTDLLAAAFALANDPMVIPPTLLLVAGASVGNGIRHCPKVYLQHLAAGALLVSSTLALRQMLLPTPAPDAALLVHAALVAGLIYYTYLLVYRIDAVRAEAERLSEHDALTGVCNRRGLEKAWRAFSALCQRSEQPLAMIIADLDGFKEVNDRHGHLRGDQVLRRFALLAGRTFRRSDVIARYGGDEFVILCPGADMETARRAADRLRRAFLAWARTARLPVGVSMGIGQLDTHIGDLAEHLRRVDAALYQAKRAEDGRKIVTAG